jgi:hypothetical protein
MYGDDLTELADIMPPEEYSALVAGHFDRTDVDRWQNAYPEYMGIWGTIAAIGARVVGGVAKGIRRKREGKRKRKAAKAAAAASARAAQALAVTQAQQQRKTLALVLVPALALGAFLLLRR